MWITAKAPSLAEFQEMAHESFGKLPDEFRVVRGGDDRVDDFPTDEVLDELGAQTEFDCSACFSARPAQRSNQDIAPMPNMIWLDRGSILDDRAEHRRDARSHRQPCPDPRTLRARFRPASDDDMEAIEAQVADVRNATRAQPDLEDWPFGRVSKDEQTVSWFETRFGLLTIKAVLDRPPRDPTFSKNCLGTPAGPAKTRPQSGKIAMDKFTTLEGVAAPLKIINVDTDMIIPASST